jgi:hypothetical protein
MQSSMKNHYFSRNLQNFNVVNFLSSDFFTRFKYREIVRKLYSNSLSLPLLLLDHFDHRKVKLLL